MSTLAHLRTISCFLVMAVAGGLSPAFAQAPEPAEPEPTAVVHGQVLSAADGTPIPRVLVSLSQPRQSVLTDENGRFEFTGAPYEAVISVHKPDYSCDAPLSGRRPVCVVSLNEFSPELHVTLTLMPQAVITGRIVDTSGAPVSNLDLELMAQTEQVSYGHTARTVIRMSQTQTGSDGVYRIAHLMPGTYFLRTAGTPEPRDSDSADHGYAANYFPGTSDFGRATPISLKGGELRTVNLAIPLVQFQSVTLSYVWNRPELPSSVGFGLSSDIGDDDLSLKLNAGQRTFHIFAPPGDYTLHLFVDPQYDPRVSGRNRWPDGSTDRYVGSANFSVRDAPVQITNIRLQQPQMIPLLVHARLIHRAQREAASTPVKPYETPFVRFELLGDEAQANQEVSWRADNGPSDLALKASPGKYSLTASVGGEAYIEKLTCGSINLLREPLMISPDLPPCTVDAFISDDTAAISIGLTPKAKELLTAAGITVTDFALFPLENTMEAPYSGFVWLGSMPRTWNIEPGSYIAIIFDGRSIAWLDPEKRKQLLQRGVVVTLTPGQAGTVLLDWLPEFNDPKNETRGIALGRVLP